MDPAGGASPLQGADAGGTGAIMQASLQALQAAMFLLLAASFWWLVKHTLDAASARSKNKGSREVMLFYASKKEQLDNHRLLRSSYLLGAIIYVSALTYSQLILSPAQLTVGQVFGLLLAYFVVAVVCWSMAVALVPFFEGILMDYNTILAAIIFVLYSLFCNYGHYLGVTQGINHHERLVAYNLFWLLEDAPLVMYLPLVATMSMMHMINHLQLLPSLMNSPASLLSLFSSYLALGLLLPMACQFVLRYTSRPSKLPAGIFFLVCASANMLSIVDLMLRTPRLAEPLQDAAKSGHALAELVRSTLLQHQPNPQGYSYGMSGSTMLFGTGSLLGFTMMSTVVLSLSEEPPLHEGSNHAQLLKALQRYPFMLMLLGFLRTLPMAKKYMLCALLGISGLQVMGISSIVYQLLFSPPGAVVNSAPVILLSVMLGVILEVVGVLYIIMPGGSSWTADDSSASVRSGVDNQDSLATRSNTLPAAGQNVTQGSQSLKNTANFDTQGGVSSSGMNGMLAGPQDDVNEFRARIEALANFKTFMQGLDEQPGVYSLDEFIRGAANAIRGVFPQVHHASFCLLNSSRSVNMYTFLGEGSQKPPRINVAVAPGTLIYHVLNNCQPVFISNIATFPGPYSDVQFMRFVLGLKSVTCLPLVVAGSRILGVLRLGFEDSWNWVEHEKSLAKQLALVLSSGSQGMSSQGMTRMQEGVMVGGGLAGPAPMPAAGGMGPGGQPAWARNVRDSHGSGSGSMMAGMEGMPNEAMMARQQQMGMQQGMHSGHMGPMGSNLRSSGGHGPSTLSSSRGHALGAGGGSMSGYPGGGSGRQGSSGFQGVANPYNSQQSMGYPGGGMPMGGQGRGQGGWGGSRMGSQDFGPGTGSIHAGMGGGQMMDHEDGMSIASGSQRMGMGAVPSPRAGGGAPSGLGLNSSRGGAGGGGMGPAGQPAMPSADIKMMEVIGRGGFGSVYKAFWKGRTVAVKVLEHGDEFVGCADPGGEKRVDTSGRRAALLEGAMTSTISHPNVVQTFDYRVVHLNPTPNNSTASLSANRVVQETHIIMEWCDRGSLQDAMEQGSLLLDRTLRTRPNEPEVDMDAVVMTLAEVACAMEYLHAHRITHRDLKPKNVLLRSSNKDRRGFCAKVSDFGLSQVLPDGQRTQVSQKYSGTVTHMPPELIEDGKVYQQGDVYAFGIMMWEVYTGLTPYANMAHPQIMVAVVTHNLRPKFPETCPEWYKSLAYKCWRKDPKLRPSFAEITAYLQTMVPDKGWQVAGDSATAEGAGKQ